MGGGRKWTSTANLRRCVKKEGCECARCYPLYAYGDTSDLSSEDEAEVVDTVARLYGFPSLPTQQQLREQRKAEGRGLTPYEAHELAETRKYHEFVNGFELAMAAQREVETNSVFYVLFEWTVQALVYIWTILVALARRCYGVGVAKRDRSRSWDFLVAIRNRSRAKVWPTQDDTGIEGDYSARTSGSEIRQRRPHVIIHI